MIFIHILTLSNIARNIVLVQQGVKQYGEIIQADAELRMAIMDRNFHRSITKKGVKNEGKEI